MRVSTVLFGLAHFTSLLAAAVMSHEGACLQGGKHKATPSPEPYLKECSLYSENSCCSELDIQDLSGSVSGVENSFWDKCGLLSPICESFLKRVVCFYRCSPDAARWPHPHHDSSLKAVPLCHSFCRDWYEACKTDMTCARDWTTDPRGQNCTGSCVPYQQMYQHGRDLCESLWSDAFMTIEDDPGEEDGVEGHSCGCLTLSPSDLDVIAALRVQENDPEELDTTKSGLRQYRAPCPPTQPQTRSATAPPQARRSNDNTVLRKRSVLASDTEGSGSGF
ncbi:riboflavin-binding protein-like isoform X3 [Myxocyprinus asiaticus]|nr:riboflavin-binding protein-like isoform X3 [Myxocyprinus asiaticus]XP_051569456.1 riboflavin-binding protein-like isoform X3 [Myxocyprinus asiaticus]